MSETSSYCFDEFARLYQDLKKAGPSGWEQAMQTQVKYGAMLLRALLESPDYIAFDATRPAIGDAARPSTPISPPRSLDFQFDV